MGLSTSAGIGIISSALGVSLAAAVVAVGSAPAGSAPAGSAPTSRPAQEVGPSRASCPDLLERYVHQGLRRVTAWGWDGPPYIAMEMDTRGMLGPSAASGLRESVTPTAPQAATSRATSSGTGTNVQEAGVDEPDVVKTDGRLLVRIQGGALLTYDVTGQEPELLSSLDLPGTAERELLLVGDRVVVTGRQQDAGRVTTWGADAGATTRVVVVDLEDPEAPEVVDDTTYDADLVTSRLHGETVRLVLSSGLPDLPFVHPNRWLRGEEAALEYNRKIVRTSTLDDWLPAVTRDGSEEPVVDCGDIEAPDDAGLGTLAVVGFDPEAPTTWSGAGLTTDSTTAYFSPNRMYVATSPYASGWWGPGCCVDIGRPVGRPVGRPYVDDGTSTLHAFGLEGDETTYLASGEVDGQIADRWSMDEYAGVLRVAVGPTSATGDFNSIVLLREDGDRLVEAGRVDHLGPGETIESMRWFDGLAIMVTFRQVDPLYAVDLTDPDAPRLLGKLKIPGFSEYLHPLGSQRLVGMGQSGGGFGAGAQAALFDVSDLTDPRRIDAVEYAPGTQAGAATDPRQFTWLPDERTVLTVVAKGYAGRTGWVSELRLDDGRMHNRMVEVEHGDDVADVRLVPLPDGRVVLVTGESVSSFAL